MLNLNDREWREFRNSDIFGKSINSKAFHSLNLNFSIPAIPYVTRTNLKNGLYGVVGNIEENKNPKNSISFGAENATYFYQPYRYITGNKMYYYYQNSFNRYICLFIISSLNKGLLGCGFGYGIGLTGKRSDVRKILLPINEQGHPDYIFMEEYIKEREGQLIHKYKEFIKNNEEILNVQHSTELRELNSVEWAVFNIKDIFTISAGKRLTKADMDSGNIPFIGATDSNNGITSWIATPNASFDKNVLGVNYNGSVVESFYHGYGCVFSDDVKRLHLKNYNDNKYVLLFLKTVILQQKEKYTYGYKFNGNRMEKQKILLPVDKQGNPDYDYMEKYAKKIMLQKYRQYLDYISS